jgi:hypothetical protein
VDSRCGSPYEVIGYPPANPNPTMLEQGKPPQNLTRIRVKALPIKRCSATIHSRGRDSCSGLVFACSTVLDRFSLVSMVSVNLRIWFYGVEKGDAGETIEREESQ